MYDFMDEMVHVQKYTDVLLCTILLHTQYKRKRIYPIMGMNLCREPTYDFGLIINT